MKQLLRLILFFTPLIVGQTVQGQVVHKGIINMKQNRIEVINDTLLFDMDILIQGLRVNRSESLTLYPILINNSDSLKLLPIVLNGSMVQRKVNRAVALKGQYVPQTKAFVVLKNDPVVPQIISYKDTLQYVPWMKECSLKLVGIVKDHNEKVIQVFSDLLTSDLNISN